jgi:hypothetical protein
MNRRVSIEAEDIFFYQHYDEDLGIIYIVRMRRCPCPIATYKSAGIKGVTQIFSQQILEGRNYHMKNKLVRLVWLLLEACKCWFGHANVCAACDTELARPGHLRIPRSENLNSGVFPSCFGP